MKKLVAPLTLAIFTLALTGCYYPGYYGQQHYNGGGYSYQSSGYGGDHNQDEGDRDQNQGQRQGPEGYNRPY